MAGVPYTFATATSNIPLLELDVCFATQVTIGTTQVGLGNTTNSLANLTSISLAGGDTISTWVSGTFTPTDQSGDGLSLTVVRAVYTQIGTRVWVELTLTYPATASSTPSKIGLGAIPACANVAGVSGAWLVYYGGAVFLMGIMNQGTNTLSMFNSAAGAATNAAFNNTTIRMQFSYSTV